MKTLFRDIKMRLTLVSLLFILFSLQCQAQLYDAQRLSEIFDKEGCPNTIIRFEESLNSINRQDSLIVHNYSKSDSELRYLFVNLPMHGRKSTCYATLIESCIKWDKKNNIKSDSLAYQKYLIAGAYYKFNQLPKRAFPLLDSSLLLAKRYYKRDHKEIAKIHRNYAETYFANAEYQKSNKELEVGINMLERLNAKQDKRRLYNNFSRNYNKLNNFDIALLYNICSKVYADTLDPKKAIWSNIDIAEIYLNNEQNTNAIKILTGKKHEELSKKDFTNYKDYYLLNILARSFHDLDNEKARDIYLRNRELIINNKRKDEELWINACNLSIIDLLEKKYESAAKSSDKLRKEAIRNNLEQTSISYYIAMKANYNLQNFDTCLDLINEVENEFYLKNKFSFDHYFDQELNFHILALNTLLHFYNEDHNVKHLEEILKIINRTDAKLLEKLKSFSNDNTTTPLPYLAFLNFITTLKTKNIY